jgi:hypothetical protein
MKTQTLSRRWPALALIPAGALATLGAVNACGAEFTYDCGDGTTRRHADDCPPSSQAGSGGTDPVSEVCTPDARPDPAGIFVDASAPPGGTGTREAPFASLAEATAITGVARATVYVRQGRYAITSTLTLPALSDGLIIDGGWGADWQRDCSPESASKTVVQGTSELVSPVLRVAGGVATVRRLTVQTIEKAPAATRGQSGASLVALYVTGSTSLHLDAAVLWAGDAGNGGQAAASANGTEARGCNGLTDCQSGADAADVGAAGSTKGAKLTVQGFVPGDGEDGKKGEGGENGTRDKTKSDGDEGLSCFLCAGADKATCEAQGNIPSSDTISADGRCGCGGEGGTGGIGGRGGGASIALLNGANTTKVSIVNSTLVAGDGGNGTTGSEGQEGTLGTAGIGGQTLCRELAPGAVKCTWNEANSTCNMEPAENRPTTPGEPGGPGGRGAAGGKGGPGAGGPSYALALPNGTSVQLDANSKLMFGDPGVSGDGTTRSEALDRKFYLNAPSGLPGRHFDSALATCPQGQ